MLRSLYRRAQRAVSSALPPYDRERERPPRRLGCVDVDVFATPRDEEDVTFLRRVKELKKLQDRGEALPADLIDFFADRFERLEIGRIVGCPFDTYLERPLVVE